MRHLLGVMFFGGILLATQAGCAGLPPLSYSAKSIQGRVVDAATGQPVAGVIVVAQWILTMPGTGAGPRLQVLEIVTDTTGAYQFPAWGPKVNPRYPLSRLVASDPLIDFFLPGYTPRSVVNNFSSTASLRASEWDGKTITLERFTGPDNEWVMTLMHLQNFLGWGDEMDWRLVPRMTLALELERLRLESSPVVQKRGMNLSGLYELGITLDDVRRFLEGQK
jgi:hypothetical protein